MNGGVLIVLFVVTAISFSFRYVRWLSMSTLAGFVESPRLVALLQQRHAVMWLVGLVVQIDALLCYLLCGVNLWICILAILAVAAGKVHDVMLGQEIERGLCGDGGGNTIPTVSILAVSMATALCLHVAGDECRIATGGGVATAAVGGGCLLMLHCRAVIPDGAPVSVALQQ